MIIITQIFFSYFFSFFYVCTDDIFRLDATEDDSSLGRLVNDEWKNPNANVKVVIAGEKPHLCLFASKNLNAGEEIRYDYGKKLSFPWRVSLTFRTFVYMYFLITGSLLLIYLYLNE